MGEIAWNSLYFAGGVGFAVLVFVLYALLAIFLGGASLSRGTISLGQLLSAAALLLFVAVGEELTDRGVLFRQLDQRWGFVPALLVSSFIFGLGHLVNPSSSILVTVGMSVSFGFLFALLYMRHNNLWAPIGCHFAWNFTEGVVLGTPISGFKPDSSLWLLDGLLESSLWGSTFGPESSWSLVGITLFINALLLMERFWRKRAQNIMSSLPQ